jgi:hypothetical protein
MVENMLSFVLLLFENDSRFIPHKSNDIASKKNGHPEFAG